jgi:hypothetical protein
VLTPIIVIGSAILFLLTEKPFMRRRVSPSVKPALKS